MDPAIKLLQGNPGHRPIVALAEFDDAIPDPPEFLGDVARGEWMRLVAQLRDAGVLRTVDRTSLASYCAAYGHWANLEELVLKDLTVRESMTVHAAIRGCMKIMQSIGSEFGLSPVARLRVQASAVNIKDDEDDGILDA